jgi:hypothetical protein
MVGTRVWISFERFLEDWKTTVEWIGEKLGVTWPKEPTKVSAEAATVVRPRHRHHRCTEDSVSTPLSSLTMHAWDAARHGLNGDEKAVRELFDEIRAPIQELDRLSLPQSESMDKCLAEAIEEARDCERFRHQLDLLRASIIWRLISPFLLFPKRANRAKSALSKTHVR